MPNYELDNQLKTLSGYVYKAKDATKPKDWIDVKSSENKKTGFYAEAFFKGNDIVIAYRGTDTDRGIAEPAKDVLKSDIPMGTSFLPSQTVDARNFYEQIKNDFPNQNIILTGHSLGGSLAQIVGSETGEKTVTFEAYGIKNALDPDAKFSDNITNYGNANDPVFMANVDNQIGKTFVTNGYESNEGYVDKKLGFNNKVSLDYHKLDNIGDISKAVEYDKYSKLGNTVLKGSVEYNDTKQFTREDIANMTPEEYQKNEPAIMAQMKESGIPTKAQTDIKTKSSPSNSSKTNKNSSSNDGNWITINGHHVLLDN